jgi:hypothetical protein
VAKEPLRLPQPQRPPGEDYYQILPTRVIEIGLPVQL